MAFYHPQAQVGFPGRTAAPPGRARLPPAPSPGDLTPTRGAQGTPPTDSKRRAGAWTPTRRRSRREPRSRARYTWPAASPPARERMAQAALQRRPAEAARHAPLPAMPRHPNGTGRGQRTRPRTAAPKGPSARALQREAVPSPTPPHGPRRAHSRRAPGPPPSRGPPTAAPNAAHPAGPSPPAGNDPTPRDGPANRGCRAPGRARPFRPSRGSGPGTAGPSAARRWLRPLPELAVCRHGPCQPVYP
ncbi:translation initiation factor IF-2-like [Strigops habroptila]|uniref:translation initiation factor IF-2-like n=1 Tax=Strigops habroptila TaxID=2489341 RepID=UPI0011D02E5A|nr:translation initiation factor IF-2-like [Strigops habroptila]